MERKNPCTCGHSWSECVCLSERPQIRGATPEERQTMQCRFCERFLKQIPGGIITKKLPDGGVEHRCAHGADCFDTVAAKTIPPAI